MLNMTYQFCADSGTDHFCEPSDGLKRSRPLIHYREAIADYFVELLRWLDIRPLWQRGDTRYFRVNFWKSNPVTGEEFIGRSVFLAVDESFDGLTVREVADE